MRALIALLAAPLLFGQDDRYTTKLGTETAEFLGGIVRTSGDGNAHNAYATRLTSGLCRWVSLYGEFAYSRIISDYTYLIRPAAGGEQLIAGTQTPAFGLSNGIYSYQGLALATPPEHVGFSRGSLMDFGGGVQLHLSGARVQPYALAGIGAVRSSGKATFGAASATFSHYELAGSFGGGLRFFANRNVGLSLEAKTVPIHNGGRFERYALGIFYQGRAGSW